VPEIPASFWRERADVQRALSRLSLSLDTVAEHLALALFYDRAAKAAG